MIMSMSIITTTSTITIMSLITTMSIITTTSTITTMSTITIMSIITIMTTTPTITTNTGKNAAAAADMITGMTIMSMDIIIMQMKCLQAGAARRQRRTQKKAFRKF